MPRVVLLTPTTSYRSAAFVEAAQRLSVDVTIASDKPNSLEHLNPAGLLTLDFANPARAAQQAAEFDRRYAIDAVVPVDSLVTESAAAICSTLGLPHNSPTAVRLAEDKFAFRQAMAAAGVATPRFQRLRFGDARTSRQHQVGYPCVIKPLSLSASQGVMRVDSPDDFEAAVHRLRGIVNDVVRNNHQYRNSDCNEGESSPRQLPVNRDCFLVEQYVNGAEFSLEGMLQHGRLHCLALFDKPDPLDGPFFEESIYITPSRLSPGQQLQIIETVQASLTALKLTEGPIHAEVRRTHGGPMIIEIHPRSIGGLCSRVLRFGTGLSLEELIIRQSLGASQRLPPREQCAAGVMMISIPRTGRYEGVQGERQARQVQGIEDLAITAHPGQRVVSLPEGSTYLGFLFARSESTEQVELALRTAHAHLEFDIRATAPTASR